MLGVSRSVSGSGASAGGMSPRTRWIGAVSALSAAMALAFGVTLAQGAKEVTDYFGSGSGTLGAEFNTPRDVAVNQTGAGTGDAGDIYVVDDANHRIQRFDSDRDFVSAWGADVAQPAAVAGSEPYEVCVTAANCKAGVPTGGTGTTASNGVLDNPQSIAVDQDTGRVFVADRDNRRINAYDGDGTFLFSVGRDVQDPDGDTATEVCGDVAGDVCRLADGGNGAGNIGAITAAGTLGVAVSPPDGNPATGTVFLADSQNRRVNTYGLDGTTPASFGSSAEFGSGTGANLQQPRDVAVDSRGIVYASDSSAGGQIDRYDTLNANGGGVGFLPSISAPPLLAGTAATTTGGLAVDPDSDGAGSDEDVLYVLRDPTTGPTVVQQYGPTNDPGLTTAPAAVDDTHGAGAGFGTVTGFGGDPTTNRLFVSTTAATVGASGHRVYVLGEAAAPTATIDDIDSGSTSATIEGSVDVNGAQSGYRFEFSTDGGLTWTPRPTGGDLPLAVSDDPQEVGYELEGLDPGTEYDVRLVAKHVFGTTTGTSGVETFTTDSASPVVGPIASAEPGTGGATLTGRVDTSGQPTTYRFEYGLTDEYGATAPVPDGVLGAGQESQQVSGTLTGLEPATTYHYRLVASNTTGTAEGENHTFTTASDAAPGACPNQGLRTGPSADLPGCRAYEQVSPIDKNGGDILWSVVGPTGGRSVAGDGDRAIFVADTEFAGPISGGSLSHTEYLARRGSGGWETVPMVARVDPPSLGGFSMFSTPELEVSLLRSPGIIVADPPDLTADDENVYWRDNATDGVSPFIGISDTGTNQFVQLVSTPDASHVMFASTAVLPTGDTGIPSSPIFKVYEVVDGLVRLVSVSPGGSPLQGNSQPAGTSSLNSRPYSGVGGISDAGRHAFFHGDDNLYRRSDGATTTLASPSQRNVSDPAGVEDKQFLFATPDGGKVFFTSSEQLTDDANTGPGRAGADLYRYDLDTGELADLSATPGGNGADVLGVAGFSDSGNRIYYVAEGVAAPGGTAGQPNLFLWEDDGTAGGATRFVATLAGSDSKNWFKLEGDWTARTTPDGAQIAFESGAVIPGHDNGGTRQVYRYDADADGGAGELTCVSCNPSGDLPLGPSNVPNHAAPRDAQRWELPRFLSADGRRVFFNSEDALVSRDANGEIDAYMWEDGVVSLLSTGRSDVESRLYNASRDGDDAFILTGQQLVAQDNDDLTDLYSASVGGGFAAQPSAPDCAGDGCQSQAARPPVAQITGSDALRGRGNLERSDRVVLGIGRPTRAQLGRLMRGRAVALRVRVSRAARVRVVVRANGRALARGVGRSVAAGRARVRLRVGGRAARRLRQARSVRLTFRVSAPGARPQSLRLRIRGNR